MGESCNYAKPFTLTPLESIQAQIRACKLRIEHLHQRREDAAQEMTDCRQRIADLEQKAKALEITPGCIARTYNGRLVYVVGGDAEQALRKRYPNAAPDMLFCLPIDCGVDALVFHREHLQRVP